MANGDPTLDPGQTARIARDGARASGGHRTLVVGAVVVLVGLVAVAIGLYSVVGQQRYAATSAQQLSEQLRQHGLTPVVQAPAPIAGPAGQPGQPGATGKQGPGPSQEKIDAAVFGYLAVHPPGATPAMVAVQVAAYLTAHPPRPGPPPTSTQIATAASDYIAAHAGDFQGATGASGTNGSDGQNASDDQVASAVAAYCDAHGQCQGATGATGPQGAPAASWSWQDPSSGVTETCTRDSGSPDDAPTYTCSADQTVISTPPTTGGLLNLGGN